MMMNDGSSAQMDGFAGQQQSGDPGTTAQPAAPIDNDPLPRAPELLFANSTEDKKLYWDRSHYDSPESQMKALTKSSTLYIGNMAFSTRSANVHSHFSQIGPVRRVIMGMDRFQKTPCGFGFVEYVHREDALLAISNLTSTKLDGRIIRVELDAGFQSGRQYGRGASGGQVRDDKRRGRVDPARNNPHKRQKTLNWTPADQVQQEQHNQQQPPPPPLPQSQQPMGGDAMAGPVGATGGIAQPPPPPGEPPQEGNSRFRDE